MSIKIGEYVVLDSGDIGLVVAMGEKVFSVLEPETSERVIKYQTVIKVMDHLGQGHKYYQNADGTWEDGKKLR